MPPLAIPLSWLNDRVSDCLSNEDELTTFWPTCKLSQTKRRVSNNATCKNVYFCKRGSLDYVELSNLCDGKEDCGEEKSVCRTSRNTLKLFVRPISLWGYNFMFYCLPGLKNIERLSYPCVTETFYSPDYPIFGQLDSDLTTLVIPNTTVKCENVFGEINVYSSCTGRCSKGACPLRPHGHDSCPGIPNKGITLAKNKYLTFLVQRRDGYHNNFFQCNNKICLSFNKVCNLVDDCGDGSDEAACKNFFQCTTSGFYISIANKCDGQINCQDFSDECNDQCGKNIISGGFLTALAWVFGGSAVFLNVVSLSRGILGIRNKQNAALVNREFSMLINVGDFMTGLYLLLIAVTDSVLVGKSYCKKQLTWLSSNYCVILGVINTTGSTLSLFSMTFLSIFRVMSITKRRKQHIEFAKLKIGIVTSIIIVSSISIACIPILSYFDDLFVNGMAYDDINFFIGSANKMDHLNILRAYFGKISKPNIRWKDIENLLSLMFSNDYGEIRKRKIHFYGNDGVCLFKFFVKQDDPQRLFVWMVITINFTCVVVISVCYGLLNTRAGKTRKTVTGMMANRTKEQGDLNHQSRRLQRNITRIIITDFLCWVPFLFTCLFHSLEIIDATFLYSVFSVVILPINSCINPLIYDNYFRDRFNHSVRFIKKKAKEKLQQNRSVEMDVIKAPSD